MSPEQFLEQFGYLADAPNGIARLRELILQLAVRGKLVEQNSNDEPASVLLKKIKVEKERLIKEKKIRKSKPLPPIDPGEVPFELPARWEWQRLEMLFYPISVSKNKVKTSEIQQQGSVPVVDQGQSFIAGYVDRYDLEIEIPGPVIIFGDHTCALKYVDFNFIAGADGVKILRPVEINDQYFFLVLNTLHIDNRGYGRHYRRLVANYCTVPPLPEQSRIVAKVDQLMAFCDELEAKQNHRTETHSQLIRAAHYHLTEARDPANLQPAWYRIRDHFDHLYTTPEAVKELRQTILQLAVQGKLVPQDPSDEPASVLLEKIMAEKEQLVNEGTIKKVKSLPPINLDEVPFELPEGWEWSRLGILAVLKGGLAYKSSLFSDSGKHQVIRMGNIRPDYLRPYEKPVFISVDLAEETSKYQIELNDILLTMTGTKGKRDYLYSLIIQPGHLEAHKLYLNQRLCIIRGLMLVHEYLNMVIKDDRLLDAIYAQSTGTANQANIGMVALNNWLLPLPPFAEQHRIVAKVDQLMALCDELESKINISQTTAEHYAEAITQQIAAA